MSALLLLAASLSAPDVDMAFARRVQQRYPQWAVRDGQQTSASIELTVLADGKVADCRVLESTGSSRLAGEVCASTIGLKLKPARDDEGNPAVGLLRTELTLQLSPARSSLRPIVPKPDVELTVNQLPADPDQLDLEVALLVSPEGVVRNCEGREPRRGNQPPPTILVSVACEQAKEWRGKIVQDASGVVVPYVTNLRVRFVRAVATAES